jgi:signal transduction histidine kinase
MLGVDRQRMQGTLLRRYLADRRESPKLLEHLRRCRTESGRIETLIALKTAEGTRLDANLISHSRGAASFFHTAMVDLTEKLRTERRLSLHARRIELLADTAAQLLIDLSPRSLLGRICVAAAREIDADLCFNYFLSANGASLLLENCIGLSDEKKAALREVRIGEGLCGLAAERRQALVLSHIQDGSEGWADGVRALGIRAFACYPLIARDRLLGTLSFATTQRDAFSDEELQFLRTLSGLVTASIDRSRLIAETSAARDAAEKASRAKDDFLATLSHELRTPLNPVLLTASDAAANEMIPDETREMFNAIRKNVELEARLIDDLLDITRVTRGKIYLRMAPCRIESILLDALATVEAEVTQKRLEVKLRMRARDAIVLGDSVRLQQVFWNLLRNAIKFTPVAGKLRISTAVIQGGAKSLSRLSVKITDSGMGMSRDELERVFQPFTQGKDAAAAAHPGTGGLGLGLAISKSLVDLHSGIIFARSRGRGRGSSFVVELPLASVEDLFLTPAPTVTPFQKSGAKANPCAEARVLLVEDHESTRAVMLRMLTRRHCKVEAAGSVAEALAIADGSDSPFDVLISDIGLPDGSGFDVIAALRKKHPVPGIALTGYGTDEDVRRSREAGFLTHLTKPVSIHALERAMAEILE